MPQLWRIVARTFSGNMRGANKSQLHLRRAPSILRSSPSHVRSIAMSTFTRRSLLLSAAGLAGASTLRMPGARAAAGEVNIYSARHYPADEQLFARFTEETGIAVNQIKGTGVELMERIKLEGEQSPCDLFVTVDAGNLWRAQDQGIYQPVSSPELEKHIPANLREPTGLWFSFAKRARVIVYDTAKVKEDELSTYQALADEKWKKRILIRSSGNIYNQS